jgi:putative membrane protein
MGYEKNKLLMEGQRMKKNVKRAGRTALSSVLVLGMVLCNSSFAEAKKVSKMESVYVTAGADGAVQKITVADWLKDSGLATGSLKDSSNLTDITNVKGEETFTQSGEAVDWATAGEDIYYQGQSDKEIPVDLKVTYTLDGKEMAAEEMAGKSGKATIHFEYINKSKTKKTVNGEKVDIYTPFVMVTGMILSSDNFSNVEIDHGRIINDGSNNVVVGLGTPGLAESLNLSDDYADELTSDFTVTADVTDFEMGNTFTYGSPSLLDELNIDEIGDLDDLEDKLETLTDSAEKLLDGTGTLSDNMEKFADKMGDLKTSIKKFQTDGVEKLTDGIDKMASGGTKLKKGVKTYTDGVVSLAKGSKAYVAGADKIAKGNSDLYDAVSGLPAQIKQFNTGLTTYTAGVDKIGTKENADSLKSGAKAVSAGITTVNESLTQLKATFENNEKLIAGLQATIEKIPDTEQFAELKTTQKTLLTQLQTVTAAQKTAIEQLETATGESSQLKTGADKVASSVATVMDSICTLSSNSTSLTSASKKLNDSIPTLVSSIKKLRDGGVTLTKNDTKLLSGAKALTKASKKINASVKKVNKGVKSLQKGGKSLNKATTKLVDGVNKLETASGKLSDGAVKLNTGMDRFNRKGIIKLNNIYEDDVKEVIDRLDAIIDAGKEYNSFSGLSSSMDGEVKFIIETDAIENENQE